MSLLPNLELGPLYDQTSLSQPGLAAGIPGFYAAGYTNAPSGINNLQVLATPVNTFLCPSDTQAGHASNQLLDSNSTVDLLYATTNYKACAGSNWVVSIVNGAPSSTPVTWPMGRNQGNSDGVDHGNGVICRGGATTPGGAPLLTANMDLRDGARSTILLGEAVPAWCGWSLWFWFDGSTATCGIPMNVRLPGVTPEAGSANWRYSYGFASRHPSGANFAGCDQSVHYVNQQIDMSVYWALATIDGGEPVNWP